MRDAPSVTSVGQASAALGTTAGEHLAAILRGHSLAEAVLLGALTLLGLIGTEHCMTPPLHRNPATAPHGSCRTYSTAGGKVNSPAPQLTFFGPDPKKIRGRATIIIQSCTLDVNKNVRFVRFFLYS